MRKWRIFNFYIFFRGRRNRHRKKAKAALKQSKKKLNQKLGLFDKIPDNCLTCEKKFDKTSRDDVSSFRVVVREKEGVVNLYCQECWEKATTIVENFTKTLDTQ